MSETLLQHNQKPDERNTINKHLHDELTTNLEQLLATAQPRLSHLAYREGIAAHAVDDVIQETLLEAWSHLDQLRSPERFHAWLNGICHNVCLRWKRKQGLSNQRHISLTNLPFAEENEPGAHLEESIADPLPLDPFDVVDRQDLTTLLERALSHLPDNARDAVELCYLAELPQHEAALRLGLTIKALESRLLRARQRLRQILSTELHDEAESFGLMLDQDAATGWRETRIWCMFCARHRLYGLIETLPDGRTNLRMRCPQCGDNENQEWILTGGLPHQRGLRSFRPLWKYSQQLAKAYWTSEENRRFCICCNTPIQLQISGPGKTHYWLTSWNGLRLVGECPSCSGHFSTYIGFLTLAHPEVQKFITQHPRWINEPEILQEYMGYPVFRVCITDITSASRLIVLLDAQRLTIQKIIQE